MNSSSNRHIVQIFNQDQTKSYATILAIPSYRLTPKDKIVITFNEGLRGQPELLRAWFYPGANWGEEFVYPQTKAVEFAKVINSPILALQTKVKQEVAKPEEPEVATALSQMPVVGVKPSGEVVELTQVVQAPPPASLAAAPAPLAENKLPETASYLPLIALCGSLALAGAFTIRSIWKRVLRFVNSAPMFWCVRNWSSRRAIC